LWTSRFREIKRSEPPRASLSCAEASRCAETHWMLHESGRTSVNPPNKPGPNLFGLLATLRPSTVNDKGQIQRDLSRISKPALRSAPCRSGPSRWETCQSASCRPPVPVLPYRRAAGAKVGGASDSHEGKRCARYDQSFHHGIFPLGERKQGSYLLTFPVDIPTPEACTSEYVCSAADGICGGFGRHCGVWDT